MYLLTQAVIIANELLTERLENHRYHPCELTPILWKNDAILVTFSLMVKNFGVIYSRKEHVTHLVQLLKKYYQISIDW